MHVLVGLIVGVGWSDCGCWLVCLWVLVVWKHMCVFVSSYFLSVLFTVNEVAMTMDVHVCCSHMQMCMWMRVLCVVCMGVCVYVYMFMFFSICGQQAVSFFLNSSAQHRGNVYVLLYFTGSGKWQ